MINFNPSNSAYVLKSIVKNRNSKASTTWFENSMAWLNKNQGEMTNNYITAVGTAGVAPIFIIKNPLAKDDKNTRVYTALRQPISAGIVLGAQVPVMNAYNSMLDKLACTMRFDKCDLAAAPTKSFLKSGVQQDIIDYQYKLSINDPEALAIKNELKKSADIKEYFYQKRRSQAFYDEKKHIREMLKANTPPAYLAKSLDSNGAFIVDDLISCKDVDASTKNVIKKYFMDNFELNLDDITKNSTMKIDTVASLKQAKIKKALKNSSKNIELKKENFDELSKLIKDNAINDAKTAIEDKLFHSARIKLYTHNIYKKAKQELERYTNRVYADTTMTNAQRLEAIDVKNNEIVLNMLKKAREAVQNAPDELPADFNVDTCNIDNIKLTKKEMATVVKKLEDKFVMVTDELSDIANKPLTKESISEIIQTLKKKCGIYGKEFLNIKYFRTEEGSTFKELYKSVSAKQWLTARINNSEKYLKDFKTKSGIVVGLLILPFTCGLLNWSYPKIMKQWFPQYCKSECKPENAKEAN